MKRSIVLRHISSMYVASVLVMGLAMCRDYLVIDRYSEGVSRDFFFFFNLVNGLAFFPGSIFLTAGHGELSTSRIAWTLVFTPAMAIAGAWVFAREEMVLVVSAVLLSVLACLITRQFVLQRRLFWSKFFQCVISGLFVASLVIFSTSKPILLYVLVFLVSMGIGCVIAFPKGMIRTMREGVIGDGFGGKQLAVTLCLMFVASLGTLHFYGTQLLLLKHIYGPGSDSILHSRLSAYAFTFLVMPVALMVATRTRIPPSMAYALGIVAILLSIAPLTTNLGMFVPYALAVSSAALAYLGRFLYMRISNLGT